MTNDGLEARIEQRQKPQTTINSDIKPDICMLSGEAIYRTYIPKIQTSPELPQQQYLAIPVSKSRITIALGYSSEEKKYGTNDTPSRPKDSDNNFLIGC